VFTTAAGASAATLLVTPVLHTDNPSCPARARPADAPRVVLDAFRDAGCTFASGVPCSLLAGLFAALERGDSAIEYAPAPREDCAVGVATGALLAGRPSFVLMQNSGLGYCLNVITSLNMIYGLALPLVVSWRGRHEDAVEHDVIGARMPDLVASLGLAFMVFDPDRAAPCVGEVVDRARTTRLPAILAVDAGAGL
jgi:phosphonopyruvate decarboxylase